MGWRCGSVLQEVKSLTAPLKSLSSLPSEFRTRGAKCDKSHPYVCERGNRVKEPGGSSTSTERLCVLAPFLKSHLHPMHACTHNKNRMMDYLALI